MFNAHKLITATALALCALLPTAAVAQLAGKKVLFLSTATGQQYAGNAKDAFSTAYTTTLGGSSSDFTTNLGALAGGSYSKEDIKKADIVVLMDSSGSVADYATKIKPLMEDRKHDGRDGRPLTFIIFTSANAGNTFTAPGQFAETIKNITGWTEAHHTHIPSSGYTSVPLIANSTLASFFKGINAAGDDTAHPDDLRVNTYAVMQCVPKDNRIYGYNTLRCQRNRLPNSSAY
ncbi:MAG: hypothetical protein IKH84_05100, partial [Ottowia sp.]|nr:hypothetical protein [Ottowia sp.]